MNKRDIKRLVTDNPTSTLRYRMTWLQEYYGGTTTKEYPATLGTAEIARQINCELADRRLMGARIGSQSLEVIE